MVSHSDSAIKLPSRAICPDMTSDIARKENPQSINQLINISRLEDDVRLNDACVEMGRMGVGVESVLACLYILCIVF